MRGVFTLAAVLAFLCAGPAATVAENEVTTPGKDAVDVLRDRALNASPEAVDKVVKALSELGSVDPGDEPALLVLHNRPILTFRARFATDTPEERAASTVKRFAKATRGQEVPKLTVEVFEEGAVFILGSISLFGITEHDLDPLSKQTVKEAAEEIEGRLQLVLDEIVEKKSAKAILRAAGLSVAATLVLALALLLNARTGRAVLRRLEEGEKVMVKGVGGEIIPETRKVTAFTGGLVTLVTWAAGIFLFLIWVTYVLKRFPYTRPWGEEVYVYVGGTAKSLALGIAKAIPSMATVLLIFFFARILVRIAKIFFDSVEKGKVRTPLLFPETAMPTRRLLTAAIWVFAFVAMYPYLPGSGSEAFKGLGVILGLMLSLGGSGVVSQAMSGLVLMYSRALRKGDYVQIDETEGVVISLGMLATKIRTVKREEITIPNAVVLGTSTKNFTRLAGQEGVVLYTAVTIGYDAPWRKVHEALIAAASRTEGLRKEPKPFVRQTALSDFYVEYQINAHLEKPERRLLTLSKLHTNIQDTFNEAGIVIVSPHYVDDPAHPAPDREPKETPPP